MIGLIATDLDGTLLTERKELPEEIFGLIGQLHERGILFAPASGRQYANLKKLFAPVWEKLVFLCENGALVRYRGETLCQTTVPPPLIKRALAEIRAEKLFPMLCGADCAYIENGERPFFDYATESYTNCRKVADLDEVADREEILKIAIYDPLPATEHCFKVLPARLPQLRVILSGGDWCDVSVPASNKGAAMRFLRAHFGLKREECVAFGDHMNDYEMLLECGQAFVPENAYPPLRERFRTIPSNDEGGVILKLKEILSQGGLS